MKEWPLFNKALIVAVGVTAYAVKTAETPSTVSEVQTAIKLNEGVRKLGADLLNKPKDGVWEKSAENFEKMDASMKRASERAKTIQSNLGASLDLQEKEAAEISTFQKENFKE